MTSLIALALLAPTPLEGITDFFPLNVGDSWIYAEESENFELRTIDTVGDPVEREGGLRMIPVVTTRDNKELDRVYYQVGEGQVSVVAFKKDKPLLTPYPILVSPDMKSSWKHKGETFMQGELTDVSMEGHVKKGSVEWGGKKIDSLEVRLEATLMESFGTPYKVSQVATYGRGVGLIKMESTTKLPKRSLKMTRRLVEYRPKTT
jgi:hypothetical protein